MQRVSDASTSLKTDFVLDALEQAVHDRFETPQTALSHHRDQAAQHVAMRHMRRSATAPSF